MDEPDAPGRLGSPDVRCRASFLAAMAEFSDEGRGSATDATELGREIWTFRGSWESPAGFEAYVQWLLDQAREDSPRPEGYVPTTNLWMRDGDRYVGRIAIRHRLTDALRRVGGHIGYDVRPSSRGRGYATRMLREALPVARSLGIASALVMCDVGNVGSRKVIERAGGVLQDEAGGKLRFRVPTA